MNSKSLLISSFFISSFLISITNCSTEPKFKHLDIPKEHGKRASIIFEYTHGNPNLFLTKRNNILDKEEGIVLHMNLSNEEAQNYKDTREAYLKGDSYKYMIRPIPLRRTFN